MGDGDLEKALTEAVVGEVRFDRASRLLYSTDASNYSIEPLGVVVPRSQDDIAAVIDAAARFGVPVIPRGGGTGLAGQTVGRGIVMDCSKYLNRVLELNIKEGWVRVEPGVVLDNLNAELKPHGLQFAPDVATSSRANVGGMIGNNSAGAHSVIYGKTIDHVIELKVVLTDGSVVICRDLDSGELESKRTQEDREGAIYREIIRLTKIHSREIERRYPKVLRRVGGYNLDAFKGDRPFNLSRMIVGSEGTLATILEAKVKVIPLPKAKVLGIIQFNGLIESMRAVAPILETGPAAVELIDKMILDQTKGSMALSHQRAWVEGDPAAVLAVEYYGNSQEELEPKLNDLRDLMASHGLGYSFRKAIAADEQAAVWNVRKAGLGLLMGIKGDSKPVAFVEDAAVPPERLPDYIDEFESIVRAHNTTAGYYAHASVGLLHVRPLVNLKAKAGVENMRSIAEAVRDLVVKYGGSMSGEHGDGLVRSCWNEQLFGPVLYQAFRDVKAVFDPTGMMNPGKIVDAPMMTEHLRFGSDYHVEEPHTHFDFSADGGFHSAVEMCNGVGACRKTLQGTMCPSFMATREEADSTRGRANVLRAAISGDLPGGLTDPDVYEVLDLCLECKACKAECPSNVDMAKLKYEFLAHYYEEHGMPLRAWLFGNLETINRLGCATAPLSNLLSQTGLSRMLLSTIGISPNRSLPPFTSQTFMDWFERRGHGHTTGKRRKVALFADTYLNYNYPDIGKAAVSLLEAAGCEVVVPEKKCCGRPLLSSGMMEETKAHIAFNIDRLAPLAEAGYAILGCEPSCVSMLRDDYVDLSSDPRARTVAASVVSVEEYLHQLHQAGELDLPFTQEQKRVLIHGHCHQKALWGTDAVTALLNLPPNYNAEVIEAGCCGMAGSFGYESEHYDVSLAVGEDRLMKAVRSVGDDVLLAAPGMSCRQQIGHGTHRAARHPVEVLWEAVDR